MPTLDRKPGMDGELALRIVVLRPLAGVAYCVQRGRGELVEPARASADALAFDLTVRVGGARADGGPGFLGPLAQGPRDDRFVYVNSETLAGQPDSCWTRRAKVRLSGIGWDLVARARAEPGGRVQARLEGTARDGGPACGGVPLLDGGWTFLPAAAGAG